MTTEVFPSYLEGVSIFLKGPRFAGLSDHLLPVVGTHSGTNGKQGRIKLWGSLQNRANCQWKACVARTYPFSGNIKQAGIVGNMRVLFKLFNYQFIKLRLDKVIKELAFINRLNRNNII